MLYCLVFVGLLAISNNLQPNSTNNQAISLGKAEFTSKIRDFAWCGRFPEIIHRYSPIQESPHKNIFVITEDGILYFSIDQGFSWLNLTSQLHLSTAKQIHISKVDHNLVMIETTKELYISENSGRHWEINSFESDWKFEKLVFSAVERQTIFAQISSNSSLSSIFVSKTLGKKWELVSEGVKDWLVIVTGFIMQLRVPKQQKLIILNEGGGTTIVENDGNRDLWENAREVQHHYPYLFVLEEVRQNGKQIQIFKIANALDHTLLPEPVEFPFQWTSQTQFSIIEHNYEVNFVFMNINNINKKLEFGYFYYLFQSYLNIGNVYISNQRAKKFKIVLENNIRKSNRNCDFFEVKGLAGVYIANIVKEDVALELIETVSSLNQTVIDQQVQIVQLLYYSTKISESIETKITYNYGQTWNYLPLPIYDSKGNKLKCDQTSKCFLHLRGKTNKNFNYLYSVHEAVGIVIGIGNIGEYLDEPGKEVNTYFSRDGGHKWEELAKGARIYEIGDNGGLIVTCDSSQPTNVLEYSWDEGLTWEKLIFSEKNITVQRIVIEPENMAQVFHVKGNYSGKGIIITLDFNSLHQRNCTGHNTPMQTESDYEIWQPEDSGAGQCFFGKKIQYIRRKREARCFNEDINLDRNLLSFCECVEADFECEIGFIKEGNKWQCLPNNPNKRKEFLEFQKNVPQRCINTYKVPTGFRKVIGNLCKNDRDFLWQEFKCPESETSNTPKFKNQSKSNIVLYLWIISLCVGIFLLKGCLASLLGAIWRMIRSLFKKQDESLITKYQNPMYEKINIAKDEDDL